SAALRPALRPGARSRLLAAGFLQGRRKAGSAREAGVLRLPDVLSCGFFSELRIAPFDGGDDSKTLTVGPRPPVRRAKRGAAQQRKRVVQGIQRLHQVSIVSGLVDGLVKLAVQADPGCFALCRLELFLQSVKDRDLGSGRMLGGEARGGPFEDLAH